MGGEEREGGWLQKKSLSPKRNRRGGIPGAPSSCARPPGLARQLTVATALARLLQGVAGLQRWGGCRRNCGCRHLGALPPLPSPRCSAPFPCIIDDSQQNALRERGKTPRPRRPRPPASSGTCRLARPALRGQEEKLGAPQEPGPRLLPLGTAGTRSPLTWDKSRELIDPAGPRPGGRARGEVRARAASPLRRTDQSAGRRFRNPRPFGTAPSRLAREETHEAGSRAPLKRAAAAGGAS